MFFQIVGGAPAGALVKRSEFLASGEPFLGLALPTVGPCQGPPGTPQEPALDLRLPGSWRRSCSEEGIIWETIDRPSNSTHCSAAWA